MTSALTNDTSNATKSERQSTERRALTPRRGTKDEREGGTEHHCVRGNRQSDRAEGGQVGRIGTQVTNLTPHEETKTGALQGRAAHTQTGVD